MLNHGHVLLVEDDVTLADWVKEYLVEQAFQVTHVERGDQVMATFELCKPDIVLLDVMLPGVNGIEVCHLIREVSTVPIIMLTARADEFDEVIGLEAGANDYVIKPVRPRALLARIKNNLIAVTAPQAEQVELNFGQLVINQQSKRVVYQGNEVELSTNLFSFLWFLASQAGQVVERDNVFKALKGREYDGLDRRFDVMLSTLRKTFGDDPQNPKKFKTIWGKGYLFVEDAWQER
ncbi:response regulator transcription factor [Psychrobium sp. 1_MG-2023]|uniref:response regulator transcription factor n=1 Tax=Psychrobium sp. 1_MG-2023 TaxID=3062624 RepID=UPI000C344393|nr:response regulator transcription factor [Psychrobium sp. 1_MG-2023]MDP2562555.1 response regulator transcription factor [Psychrobium sp. 1_MG-2023]PKF54425.1 DNA-binding response regulator [Alteromonadales bacterium alter-6D02]